MKTIISSFQQNSMEKEDNNLQRRCKGDDVKLINGGSPTDDAVKLAGISISLNVKLRSSDMPVHVQEHALRCTRSFLDSDPKKKPNPTHLARNLKKEFDLEYGPAWHCIAGTSFGSFVTHSKGGFVYFSVDSLYILLFKTEVNVIAQQQIL